MEIFGVGPLEFILVLVLALIILGPEDMVGTARKIGQWVYRVVRSPTWRSIMETSADLRALPQKIVREAGLEDTMKDIKQTADEVKNDISQTTRQINTEMQAATTEVSQEMQIAAKDVNAGIKDANAEAQVALKSAADGLSGSENTIAPPEAQGMTAKAGEDVPVLDAEPMDIPHTPYMAQLETFASGLGGKEIQNEETEENTIFRVIPAENTVPSMLPVEPLAEIPPHQSYAAGLETFAQALGAATGSPQETKKTPIETQAPWAIGIPTGLNLDSEGMEVRLKKQMDEMTKAIEKLEAKTRAAASQPEEGAPPSAQIAPHGNGSQPAAAPAKVRRNAKRTPPAAESAEDEAPKPAPRKRATKTTPPTAEAAEGEVPKPAPRKRAPKTTPPTAEAAEGAAPKPAPRKRAAKKTPLPETTEQDLTSAQA